MWVAVCCSQSFLFPNPDYLQKVYDQLIPLNNLSESSEKSDTEKASEIKNEISKIQYSKNKKNLTLNLIEEKLKGHEELLNKISKIDSESSDSDTEGQITTVESTDAKWIKSTCRKIRKLLNGASKRLTADIEELKKVKAEFDGCVKLAKELDLWDNEENPQNKTLGNLQKEIRKKLAKTLSEKINSLPKKDLDDYEKKITTIQKIQKEHNIKFHPNWTQRKLKEAQKAQKEYEETNRYYSVLQEFPKNNPNNFEENSDDDDLNDFEQNTESGDVGFSLEKLREEIEKELEKIDKEIPQHNQTEENTNISVKTNREKLEEQKRFFTKNTLVLPNRTRQNKITKKVAQTKKTIETNLYATTNSLYLREFEDLLNGTFKEETDHENNGKSDTCLKKNIIPNQTTTVVNYFRKKVDEIAEETNKKIYDDEKLQLQLKFENLSNGIKEILENESKSPELEKIIITQKNVLETAEPKDEIIYDLRMQKLYEKVYKLNGNEDSPQIIQAAKMLPAAISNEIERAMTTNICNHNKTFFAKKTKQYIRNHREKLEEELKNQKEKLEHLLDALINYQFIADEEKTNTQKRFEESTIKPIENAIKKCTEKIVEMDSFINFCEQAKELSRVSPSTTVEISNPIQGNYENLTFSQMKDLQRNISEYLQRTLKSLQKFSAQEVANKTNSKKKKKKKKKRAVEIEEVGRSDDEQTIEEIKTSLKNCQSNKLILDTIIEKASPSTIETSIESLQEIAPEGIEFDGELEEENVEVEEELVSQYLIEKVESLAQKVKSAEKILNKQKTDFEKNTTKFEKLIELGKSLGIRHNSKNPQTKSELTKNVQQLKNQINNKIGSFINELNDIPGCQTEFNKKETDWVNKQEKAIAEKEKTLSKVKKHKEFESSYNIINRKIKKLRQNIKSYFECFDYCKKVYNALQPFSRSRNDHASLASLEEEVANLLQEKDYPLEIAQPPMPKNSNNYFITKKLAQNIKLKKEKIEKLEQKKRELEAKRLRELEEERRKKELEEKVRLKKERKLKEEMAKRKAEVEKKEKKRNKLIELSESIKKLVTEKWNEKVKFESKNEELKKRFDEKKKKLRKDYETKYFGYWSYSDYEEEINKINEQYEKLEQNRLEREKAKTQTNDFLKKLEKTTNRLNSDAINFIKQAFFINCIEELHESDTKYSTALSNRDTLTLNAAASELEIISLVYEILNNAKISNTQFFGQEINTKTTIQDYKDDLVPLDPEFTAEDVLEIINNLFGEEIVEIEL